MPELAADFYFTQLRLQDYLDCKRRFQLRYLEKQPWPAQIIEPIENFEQHIELGERFHRLVHQKMLGIPVEVLNQQASESPLDQWWRDFLDQGLADIPSVRFPEHTRSTMVAGYELTGKFDLIAVDHDGSILIVDWKTSRFIPSRHVLRTRMQSRVYPFILTREGIGKSGFDKVDPERIKMRYWYAQAPEKRFEFTYSEAQYREDNEFLAALIHEIEATEVEIFPLTADEQKCRYCLYRSLCDRGVEAGSLKNFESDLEDVGEWPQTLNLDEIGEVAF